MNSKKQKFKKKISFQLKKTNLLKQNSNRKRLDDNENAGSQYNFSKQWSKLSFEGNADNQSIAL